MKTKKKIFAPHWAIYLFITFSVVLIPWTVYLGLSLPQYHISSNWDVSWAGLDVGLLILSLLTGLFAYLRSRWLIISASSLGSLLLVDAWFDVLSERQGSQLNESVILAIFAEIPLAIICYYIAYEAIKSTS